MSKIHILGSDNNQSYEAVIHFDTPSGNNTVGTSPTNAMIEALADIYITEFQNSMARILKYFGHTVT